MRWCIPCNTVGPNSVNGCESEEACKLRDDVRSGTIRSLTSAKTEAERTWKSASGEYDASRVTHGIGKIHHHCGVLNKILLYYSK